jgi:hypothetical protein
MRKFILSATVFFLFFVLSAATPTFISGEFEGTYRVGERACVVRPIKMAFEVNWVRSGEKTLYFYELDSRYGKYVYSMKKNGRGYDRFVFTDDRHVSGTFIRSNGLKSPLRKIR